MFCRSSFVWGCFDMTIVIPGWLFYTVKYSLIVSVLFAAFAATIVSINYLLKKWHYASKVYLRSVVIWRIKRFGDKETGRLATREIQKVLDMHLEEALHLSLF